MGQAAIRVRYVVLFGLCLAAGLAYIHRGAPAVMETTIRADLGLSKDDTGRAFGIFFWAYALFQIPTGLLVDRIGPRRALLIFGLMGAATMALSAGTMWCDTTTGFVLLYLARLLMGIAQAGLFPASTRAITNWFPVQQRGMASGMLQSWMSLGLAFGSFLTGTLLKAMPWPWVFLIYAIPGVLWSVWFFVYFRDHPDKHPRTTASDHLPDVPRPTTKWRFTLPSVAVVLLCTQQFFRAAANVFWMTWCPTYLQEVQGLNPQTAGQWVTLPICGVVVGSFMGGIIIDWLYRRTHSKRISRSGVALVTTLLGVAGFVGVYLLPTGNVPVVLGVLTLAAIFSSGGNSCAYIGAMDLGGKNLAAVFGAMNMCGNFGAALFAQQAPRFTALPEVGTAGTVLLVAGAYAIGALCWVFLRLE